MCQWPHEHRDAGSRTGSRVCGDSFTGSSGFTRHVLGDHRTTGPQESQGTGSHPWPPLAPPGPSGDDLHCACLFGLSRDHNT